MPDPKFERTIHRIAHVIEETCQNGGSTTRRIAPK